MQSVKSAKILTWSQRRFLPTLKSPTAPQLNHLCCRDDSGESDIAEIRRWQRIFFSANSWSCKAIDVKCYLARIFPGLETPGKS